MKIIFGSRLQSDINLISLIIIIWIVIIVLINPIGNFPLNDDWAYAWTVKELLATGTFKLSDWTATNLLPQVLWGSLFCLPFGFSFTALRISTLVLGLVGLLSTYGLLREMDVKPNLCFFGSLVIALNPIYFALSNSFMNDVPSLAICILSLYFMLRGYKYQSKIELIVGICLGLLGVLTRQSSIVVMAGFGCAFLANKRINIKNIVLAFIPLGLGLFINFLYSYWLDASGLKPAMFGFQIKQLLAILSSGLNRVLITYIKNFSTFFIYLGVFLTPCLLLYGEKAFRQLSQQQKRLIYLMAIAIATGTAVLIITVKKMPLPLMGNTLEYFSIGPQSLEGYYSFMQIRDYRLINLAWMGLNLIGIFGGLLLGLCFIMALAKFLSKKNPLEAYQKQGIILNLSTIFCYLSIIGGLDQGLFDRYLIFVMPSAIALIGLAVVHIEPNKITNKILLGSFCFLIFMGTFTITATHDYLASNRVRWEALNTLMAESNIPPQNISGGMEFKGWHLGNTLETCNFDHSFEPTNADWTSFSCLWGNSPNTDVYSYTIAFIPKEGYVIEKTYSFRRWLPWRKESLYVLRKI